MSPIATRIVRLGLAGSVAALMAMPAASATRSDQPVQAWSAMAGVDVATLLEQAEDLPTSDMALGDQPYCASDAEIGQTLRHDFNEAPVQGDGHAAIELWASAQLGTWTLVAPREDDTSCIIASGIGYDRSRDVEIYYRTAGLR